MSQPLVNVALPQFEKYNRALIVDGHIINDLNYINVVSKQEASLLGQSLDMSPQSDFEFREGSDIPDNIFETFLPHDLDGVDEISDYIFYQSKDVNI